jgi:4-amino-4-deoxy-L-arabinose transferase-like glycosyltransferase
MPPSPAPPWLQRVQAQPELLVATLIAWHLLFWVLAPWLGYRMLPLDTLELLGWGQHWQWGYYKHPPLGAWLGEATLWLAGGRLEALYLLAQLGAVLTFVYVWKTARLFLPPLPAALATVILEGSYFHTYLTPNFNMNSLQLPVWAGLCFHFLRAWHGAPRHWLAAGVFAALAVLSKYSGLLLIACCALALLVHADGRRQLRSPWPWLGAALGLVLLLPHAHWLLGNWELPWHYLRGFDRTAAPPLQAHVLEPLRFGLGALSGLLFTGLLALCLRERGAPRPTPTLPVWLPWLLCLGPLLLSMAYGVATGSRLKSTWAFPFFNLAGVLLMLHLPVRPTAATLRRFLIALIGVTALAAGMHLLYKTRWGDSKTRFDGPALAEAADAYWRTRYGGDIPVVIGDHILSAIVAGYAPGRPAMLVNGDFTLSPWLDAETVDRRGGLLVCRSDGPCPAPWRARGEPGESLQVDGQHFLLLAIPPRKRPVQ